MTEQLVKTTIAIQTLIAGLAARGREERGQTAAEYLGIVVVVGIVIAALATSSIGDDIANGISDQIERILSRGD